MEIVYLMQCLLILNIYGYTLSPANLRKLLINYLKTNPNLQNELSPYLVDPVTGKFTTIKEWIIKMSQDGEYGDEVVIKIFQDVFPKSLL